MSSFASLLTARYGAAAAASIAASFSGNDVVSTLLAHKSVRAYQDRPLPPGTLEALIAAAQSAATSSNLQTWTVIAVEDPQRKARLAELVGKQAHVAVCPLFLVWLADLSRLERAATRHGLTHEALDHLEMFALALIDAALAAQNALVAAESMGLGGVYIGAVRNRPLEIAAELGLPPRVFAAFGLCIGWPDLARPAAVKPRLPQAAVLHRERYQSRTVEDDAVDAYDQTMNAFYAAQRMKTAGAWSEHSARRIATPAGLTGRHLLRSALERLGFPLR